VCKKKTLGYHATQEAAAQAYDNYVENGGILVWRQASTSQFKGVSWDKFSGKWAAQCKEKRLGRHATEEGAARAYNIEAERVGLVNLNVIPPAGDADDSSNIGAAAAAAAAALPSPAAPSRAHAGAPPGSKRAARSPPTPPHAKKLRLVTPAGTAAIAEAGANTAAEAPAKLTAR